VQKLTSKTSIRFYHYFVISAHLVASCVKVRKRLIALILKDVQWFQWFAEKCQSEFKSHRPDHFHTVFCNIEGWLFDVLIFFKFPTQALCFVHARCFRPTW
jgi:hypothetical protein